MAQSHVAFGRSSGAESKAEAAKTAGVLFPLTPALSPRRGRNIRPCFGNTTELGCRVPPKRKTKKRGLQPQRSNFPAPCERSPSPRGEGWGEGERSKLQPQAHDDSRNCQTSRVPRQSRGFPNLIMRVLLASSEVHPYSKSGGLADVVGGLSKSLAKAGHQVGIITPLYRGILTRFPELQPLDWELNFPLGPNRVKGSVWTLQPMERLTIYFIDHPGFFDRPSFYQEKGVDYPDNAERFIFFSKSVVNLARYLPWQPEVVHVHDWQAGLVPLFILHQRLTDGWLNAPPACLTIHNLAYQGFFPASAYNLTSLSWDYFHLGGVEFYGGMSCLKAGIAYADVITTVSPRYAREITTEAYGFGLDGLLRQRQNAFVGILNGIDEEEWTTVGNPHLQHSYDRRNLQGKMSEKVALQRELGLPEAPHIPLFGTITRLVPQKGVDLLLGALEEMLAGEMQFVLLGSGEPAYETGFRSLARLYPNKVAIRIGYDQGLSHRIEAACDFYLMPSRFEPCGLNQMYSLRYGTIPIVRQTGGLDDSVIDPSESVDHANGIKFVEPSVRALAKAIRKALVLYGDAEVLKHFRSNAMAENFSWARAAGEYEKVYEEMVVRPGAVLKARR